MQFSIVRLIFLFLYLWVVKVSAADTHPASYCGPNPIKVAYFEYGLAYSQGRGFDVDLLAELQRRSGCQFQFDVMPRARIWALLESGGLDFGTYGLETSERDQFAWFANYIYTKFYAVIRKDVVANFSVYDGDSFINVPSLQFGKVRSYKHGPAQDQIIERLDAQHRIDYSVDEKMMFLKLAYRRFDAAFAEPITYKKYMNELHLDSEFTIQDWTNKGPDVPHGLIISKRRFDEYQAIHWIRLINEIRCDGTMLRIYEKYFTRNEAKHLVGKCSIIN